MCRPGAGDRLGCRDYTLLIGIESLGHRLQATQRVVSTAMMITHKHFIAGCARTDNTTISIVAFLLSFKVNDVHRSLQEILVAADSLSSFNTVKTAESGGAGKCTQERNLDEMRERALNQELLFCISTNFEFSYIDYYDYLFGKFRDFNLPRRTCSTAHVLLNDTFYLPLFSLYSRKTIIYAVLYLALEISRGEPAPDAEKGQITEIRVFLQSCREADANISKAIDDILSFYTGLAG